MVVNQVKDLKSVWYEARLLISLEEGDQHVHTCGVLHNDIKGNNVFVRR